MSKVVKATLLSLVVEDVFCDKVEVKLLCSIEETQRVVATVLTKKELIHYAFLVGLEIEIEEFIIHKLSKDVIHYPTPAPTLKAQANHNSKQTE